VKTQLSIDVSMFAK